MQGLTSMKRITAKHWYRNQVDKGITMYSRHEPHMFLSQIQIT